MSSEGLKVASRDSFVKEVGAGEREVSAKVVRGITPSL